MENLFILLGENCETIVIPEKNAEIYQIFFHNYSQDYSWKNIWMELGWLLSDLTLLDTDLDNITSVIMRSLSVFRYTIYTGYPPLTRDLNSGPVLER